MLLLGLVAVALVYVPIASADVIFSDGFESANFSAWSLVQTGGDGTAAVQSQTVSTGQMAAQFTESTNSGSKAYARETFGAAQTDLTVSGDFYVAQQGTSTSSNVVLFRLFDPNSARVVNVTRQNVSGTINVGYGGSTFATKSKLALGTWATVTVHVVVAGASSTITVTETVNGTTTTVYPTTTANLGSAGIATMQIGNDTAAQAGSVVVDNVTAQSASSTPAPPVNTGLPSISGTPQQGQTLTASPGTWSGTPTSYAYQWQRCDMNGANCSPAGATGTSYSVSSADVESTLRVIVVATNSAGSNSATSAATPVVSAPSAPPANTGPGTSPPTISGTAQVGQTLTAATGTWTGAQPLSYAYQWQQCDSNGQNCNAIASGPTYTIASGDSGHTLVVAVTASNSAGSATASSASTAVVPTSSGPPGLAALWSMNETSGTTMFDAPGLGGDNGTFANHLVKLGLSGYAGNAYGFGTAYNLKSSYVSVPTANDLNPGAQNVTVSIEVNTTGTPPASPADWDLIRKGDYHSPGPWNEYKMELQQSGQISCGFDGTTATKLDNYMELQAGPKVNDGQWHTVQCVKTHTLSPKCGVLAGKPGIEVVVDGTVFCPPKSMDLGSISNTQQVVIGAHPTADQYSGALDEASLQFG